MNYFKRIFLILIITKGVLMGATIEHLKINNTEIPVVFEQNSNLPTFNLQLVFKNAGFSQDGKKNGLASLSAKVLNEGTKKLGSVQFAQKLENKAISLGASTGFETFVLELSSLKSEYKTSLELLQNLLDDPNYTQSTLGKIKTTTIGALKRKENDYDYIAKLNLNSKLFENTPLQNPASGTISSIKKITLDDIKKFIEKNLVLNNLIIIAGGDITSDELKKSLTPLLKDLKSGKSHALKTFKANSKTQTVEINKDTQQAYIYFGSPFNLDAKSEDSYIAKVASFILGGSGFGSRLMEEIRVKRGLAYSAYGSISVNKSYSSFTGYLQTKNENSQEAQELVKQLVADFVQNGVTQKELDGAKNFLLGSEPLRTETLSQRLNRAFMLYYKGLPQDFPKKELAQIKSLELDRLNNFIKEHTELNSLSFSIVSK